MDHIKQAACRMKLSSMLVWPSSWRHDNDFFSTRLIQCVEEKNEQKFLYGLCSAGKQRKSIMGYLSSENGDESKKAVKAAASYIMNLKQHQDSLRLKTDELKNYLEAYTAVSSEEEWKVFLDHYKGDLREAFGKTGAGEYAGRIFRYRKYFPSDRYFCHIIKNSAVCRHILRYAEDILDKNKEEGLRIFLTPEFHRIRTCEDFGTDEMIKLVSMVKRNPEYLEWVSYLITLNPKDSQVFFLSNQNLKPLVQEIEAEFGIDLIQSGFLDRIQFNETLLKAVRSIGKSEDRKMISDLATNQALEDWQLAAILLRKQWILDEFSKNKPDDDTGETKWDEIIPEFSTVMIPLIAKKKYHLIKEMAAMDMQTLNDVMNFLYTYLENLDDVFKILDLNSMSGKDFNVFNAYSMHRLQSAINSLLSCPIGRRCTEREFRIIMQMTEKNSGFYRIFHDVCEKLKPDTACKRLEQFLKAWRSNSVSEEEVKHITEGLLKAELPVLRDRLFSFAADMHLTVRAVALGSPEGLKDAANTKEASFLLQCYEKGIMGSMEETVKNVWESKEANEFRKFMKLPDSYYEENWETLKDFIIDGGIPISLRYFKSVRRSDVDGAFRLIVKAAICGKINDLRTRDIEKEIGFPISQKMAAEWENNLSVPVKIDGEKFTIEEDTSFSGIMRMGTQPYETCMSYNGGQYNECLLSYFDANKKIVYMRDGNGKVVARAVLRLTKAKIGRKKTSLSFTDVDNMAAKSDEKFRYSTPIIFLELLYSNYQGNGRGKIKKAFLAFGMEKARHAGVVFTASTEYENTAKDIAMKEENSMVYITRSKNKYQYLDSFGGEKTSDESDDRYVSSPILVPANDPRLQNL